MEEGKVYQCISGGSNAKGHPTPQGGFLVWKGSVISSKVAPSFECASKTYYALRNRLIEEGIIKDGIFQVNYEFTSPTAAGAVTVGWTISGNAAWKPNELLEAK